tara:strand:- start:595 stop:1494 length:900 start_codon:yes stop_codon:yes gene_type:complete
MSAEIFENIEVKNLVKLYNILENNIEYLDNAKLMYSKQNIYLRESLNFLIEIGLISVDGNNIKIHDSSTGDVEDKIFYKIAESSEFGLEVKEYLNNFINVNGTYSFKPDAIYNNATSHLRNFLIYAKKIVYENSEYKVIDNKILELFLKNEYSPKKLEKDLKDKKQLGDDAEKLVFRKEQEKVNSLGSSLIPDHVALRDVTAGYDIQSFEKFDDNIEKIYIEVKAVSKSNYKFHLSIKEKQTAIKFKDKYFIYLLPVDRSNPEKFDYNQLLRITNIDKSIFQNKLEWTVENDGFIISKK